MPLTNTQRKKITDEALAWVPTPYRGNTCLKGQGTDCAMFLFGVYTEAGFIPKAAEVPKNYSLQVHFHQDNPLYLDTVKRFAREIPESEVQPGDIVVYRIGKGYSHAAVIVSWPTHVVHALEREGVHSSHGSNLKFGRRQKVFLTLREEFVPKETGV